MIPRSSESPVLTEPRSSETERQLAQELVLTRARLSEAEATLEAIRQGGVDAVIVENPAGREVFTR